MPSMMRLPAGSLPRPTTRFWMSRTTLVMSHHSPPSFRGARSANPESRDSGSGPPDHPGMTASISLNPSLRALPLLHLRIERVAGGVADQVDAQDRDRQQQTGPEDQRRLDLEVGAALGHDVAPGRRLRVDAGAEERQDRFGQNGAGAHVSALHD